MVQLKADYMTVVSAAQKIGNVFNFSHETVEAWVEAINNAGMPATLLDEQTTLSLRGITRRTTENRVLQT